MPYVFSETPTGYIVTHQRDASVQVSLTLRDTMLVVESARSGLCHSFGLFDYYALAHRLVRQLLVSQLDLDTPRWKADWLVQVTGRRVGKALHQQWKRLVALADPTVVAVQRAVFAATFRVPLILHEPALYRTPGSSMTSSLTVRQPLRRRILNPVNTLRITITPSTSRL